MKTKKVLPFIVCLLIPLVIGGLSGFMTANEISGWFQTLNKPSFNPPNQIFGPVWTLLYLLMGISLYWIWVSPASDLRKKALRIFALQLFFNFCLSILFFSFHLLFLAILCILLMCIFIVFIVNKMIGIYLLRCISDSLILNVASAPSMTGIIRSIKTTSKLLLSNMVTASKPLFASSISNSYFNE